MSRQADALAALGRLAQIRSDLEMRRFSAFRQHVEAARERIASLEQDLQALYQQDASFSVAEARLANALAQDHSRALIKAERDLGQILPGYEAARAQAVREFGRVEVLKSLRQGCLDEARAKGAKKTLSED